MSKGISGIGFVGCELLRAAPAEGAGGSAPHAHRREVVVNGTRVKTVDIHAHCAVPAALEVLGSSLRNPDLLMTDVTARIKAMDSQITLHLTLICQRQRQNNQLQPPHFYFSQNWWIRDLLVLH